MYNIKLVINTGIHWMDVVDLGLLTPSAQHVMEVAYPDPKQRNQGLHKELDYAFAEYVVPDLEKAIAELDAHPDKYKVFDVDDILVAREYLSKLLGACKYHPRCELRVETI